MNKPLVIFIYGVPGTRKSSTAVKLAERLGIKVVTGTDQIRDALKPHLKNPFLEGPTHNRWQAIGERTPENIIKGYLKQSRLLRKAVLKILELARKRGESMILEGVHLCPDLYSELKDDPDIRFFHFLLFVEDINLHCANIDLKVKMRHGREKPWPKDKMEDIREIQRFLFESRPSWVRLVDADAVQGKVDKILEILGGLP